MAAAFVASVLLLLAVGAGAFQLAAMSTTPTSATTTGAATTTTTTTITSSPSHWLGQLLGAILLCPPDTVERYLPMVAPLPSSWEDFQTRQCVDQVLDVVYRESSDHRNDELMRKASNDGVGERGDGVSTVDTFLEGDGAAIMDPSTYGEITSIGARQLRGAMGLVSPHHHHHRHRDGPSPQPPIHFFDLGSGAGKLVCQVALELATEDVNAGGSRRRLFPHITATGVELSLSRHEAAVRAREALFVSHLIHGEEGEEADGQQQESCPSQLGGIQFHHGDFLEADLSTATHVYVSSLCFPPTLMSALEVKLGPSHAPCLQCVATLQRFPNDLLPMDGGGGADGSVSAGQNSSACLVHRRRRNRPTIQFMEMSWTRPLGSMVYVYDL